MLWKVLSYNYGNNSNALIHCCTYSLLSGFSQAQPITSQTPNGGEMPAYGQASGHSTPSRWSGLGNSMVSNAINFHDWQQSFRRELPGCLYESPPWAEKQQDRQTGGREKPEEQGCTQHPSSFLDLHSLSAAESVTYSILLSHKKPVNNVHSHNKQLCSLQVMHKESHQEILTQCSLVPSLSKESAQILVSAQNAALEAGALDLSHTTEHSTLQSWRDWEAGLLGHHLGFLLSHWASTQKSNSGHCLWLLCCVGWAEVLWKECWAWTWSLLGCEHCILPPCVRRDALTAKSWQQQWHSRLGRGSHTE